MIITIAINLNIIIIHKVGETILMAYKIDHKVAVSNIW